MTQQIPISSDSIAGEAQDGGAIEVAPELAYLRLAFVNVVMVGAPHGDWVLIDAGIPGMAGRIRSAARARFGDRPPTAIVMTHGHFDHVGVLEHLAEAWDVPVYAHPFELPYLMGTASYPPPDPHVGGGLMALISPLFPRSPVNVGGRLHPLPADGTMPPLPGWSWLHTPGHSVGHVSLWRASDRALIVGDAFVTTAQESAYAAVVQEPELHGPPKYFTHDWQAAEASVRMLSALEPELIVTGHGRAMQGRAMRTALETLAREFGRVAVPPGGVFVQHAQTVEDGTAYRPA